MRQVVPLDIVAPGSLGTNESARDTLLAPQYALPGTQNCVLDDNGRLAARDGWGLFEDASAIAGDEDVQQLFEYIQGDGSTEYIVSWNGANGSGIGNSLSDPAGNDVLGSGIDGSNGNWKFLNFNSK